MKFKSIILAAGKGTRMEDLSKPKVMFEILGKPMIDYSINHIKEVGIKDIILVVGYKKEQIENYYSSSVKYAIQSEQLGTGHAVKCGLEKISESADSIIVCYGDMPFYKPETIRRLISLYEHSKPTIAMLSVLFDEPNYWGYGRIIRDRYNEISAIVEQKDCTIEQLKIKECNPGFYIFNEKWLRENIVKLKNNNSQKEYYLTDLIEMAIKQHEKVVAIPVSEENEALGINTKLQLKEAENRLNLIR